MCYFFGPGLVLTLTLNHRLGVVSIWWVYQVVSVIRLPPSVVVVAVEGVVIHFKVLHRLDFGATVLGNVA